MILKNIEIINFRNYSHLNINFDEKINIFYGNNAQGKTNLLEAIYFLGITKSHRTSIDIELLKEKTGFFRISGTIKTNYDYNLQINYEKNKKKCFIDGNKQSKIEDYVGKMKVIMFCPEDLNLIKGLPIERRSYLDIQIEQFSLIGTKYFKVLNEFNNILKKRNLMLKNAASGLVIDDMYFEVLTQFLINKMIYIYKSRKKYVERLNDFIDDIYFKLTGYKGLKIIYKTDISLNNELEDSLKIEFKNNKNKEVILGNTLIGPQKDDILFILDSKELKKYGSQGQQRMAVIALKMASIEILHKYDKVTPILLLDDVFSELDYDKRNSLFEYIYDNVQTFITTTDLNNLNEKLIKLAKIFNVENGNIVTKGEVIDDGK